MNLKKHTEINDYFTNIFKKYFDLIVVSPLVPKVCVTTYVRKGYFLFFNIILICVL